MTIEQLIENNPPQKQQGTEITWAGYELFKRELFATFGCLTPDQYSAAIKAYCDRWKL